MFLKEKCKKKICFAIVKFKVFNPFVLNAPKEVYRRNTIY